MQHMFMMNSCQNMKYSKSKQAHSVSKGSLQGSIANSDQPHGEKSELWFDHSTKAELVLLGIVGDWN